MHNSFIIVIILMAICVIYYNTFTTPRFQYMSDTKSDKPDTPSKSMPDKPDMPDMPDKSMVDKSTAKPNVTTDDAKPMDKNTKPIFLNLNIKDICQNLNFGADTTPAPVPAIAVSNDNTDDKTDKPDDTPKSIADQLFDQKKMYNELKLKYDDMSPVYRYTNSDLYLVDNQPSTGDDVFTNRMLDMGMQSKVATDARSMYSKNSLIPYLEEELEEAAGTNGWWDQDQLEAGF